MQSSWQDPPPGGGGMQLAMPSVTPAVRGIMIACGAIWLASFLVSIVSEPFAYQVQRWFGITPTAWIEGFPLLPLWQVVTWGFLHSVGDPMHILFNMLGLYFFGTMLEGIVGTRRFAAHYAGALLVSGVVTLLLGVALAESAPTVGASGAILFVIVGMAVLRPNTRVIFILFPMTLKTLALIWVGLDVFGMLSALKGGGSNVSHVAHLSGAAWGFFAVRRGWIWRDPIQGVEAKVEQRRSEREESDTERLDELLAKIKREGIHSLSMAEKAFLKRMSKRR